MTELTTYTPGEIASPTSGLPGAALALVEWAQSAEAAYSLAETLCNTAFAPAQYKNKPVEAAAAMLAGAEVGLSPMAALRAFDVIQGTAAPRALAVRAIAQSQGHEIITDTATEDKVVMRGKRRGATEWQTVTWTIQRATKLGLAGKDQWKKQPQTMLIARATTELVRLIAADAILGIGYSIEELEDEDLPTTKVSRATGSTKVSRKPAEPVADLPASPADVDPSPPVDPEAITAKQVTAIATLASKLNLSREDKIKGASHYAGREVESTKDLSKEEAGRVIDALTAKLASEEELAAAAEVVQGELVE